jgi:hypothetical protein
MKLRSGLIMPGKTLALLPIALFSTEKLTRLSFSNKIYLWFSPKIILK